MLSPSLKSKTTMRNLRNRSFKQWEHRPIQCSRVLFFENSEMLSRFGSLMGVVSPSTEVTLSNSWGSQPVECVGIGQVAKLLAARAEVRLTCAFRSGTVRRRRCRRECGLEVTVREQQGRRMKHEDREGETERYDMRTADTLSHACTRCLYVTRRNCVRKMCVRHGVCVQPPVAHTVIVTTWVRNSESKRRNLQISPLCVHFDLCHQDVFHQFAFHQLSDV